MEYAIGAITTDENGPLRSGSLMAFRLIYSAASIDIGRFFVAVMSVSRFLAEYLMSEGRCGRFRQYIEVHGWGNGRRDESAKKYLGERLSKDYSWLPVRMVFLMPWRN